MMRRARYSADTVARSLVCFILILAITTVAASTLRKLAHPQTLAEVRP